MFLNNNKLATGIGKTKKEASQEAARNALMVLEKNELRNPTRDFIKGVKNIKNEPQ